LTPPPAAFNVARTPNRTSDAFQPPPGGAPLCALPLVGACAGHAPLRRVSTTGRDAGDCRGAPCRTIGYAVRQARPGDTVAVDSGTYREAVTVTKCLALVGRHATIDAAGQASPPNGVLISGDSAAGTRVAGFTVVNAGLEGIYALRTSRVTIEGDTVMRNDAYGRDNPLCSKHQSDCGEGIHLQSVTGSVVRGNLVREDLGGILLTDEDGPTADDTISDNTVVDSPQDCGITLASHWFDSTAARGAAETVGGVYRNAVTGNTVTQSGMSGLAIHSHTKGQNVDGNVLRDNVLAGNGPDVDNPADRLPAGISLYSVVVPIRGTVITGNRIRDEHYGVITAHADSVSGLGGNSFDRSVRVPTSIH
jgi:hypothetical protein